MNEPTKAPNDHEIAGYVHAMLGASLWHMVAARSDAAKAEKLRPFILALRPEIRQLVANDTLMPLPAALVKELRNA